MDFEFTPDQVAIRKHMRDFAEREIAPKAQMNDRECKFDWDIAKKIFKEGFLGCPVPEKYGGLGMDYVAFSIFLEGVRCATNIITAGKGLQGLRELISVVKL